MLIIASGWAFATFIYFKVAFDYAIRDLTIVGAILLGLVFGVWVFVVSGVYALRLLPYNWQPGREHATLGTLVSKTVLPLLIAYTTYLVLARLIIFGFSKRLSDRIEVFGYRDSISDTFLEYMLIIAFPVSLHYAMTIFSTYQNCKRPRI